MGPAEWTVGVMFQGGCGVVLLVLGIVLTRCCACGGGFFGVFGLNLAPLMQSNAEWQPGRVSRRPCCVCIKFYALIFYMLSLFLFGLVVFKNMRDEVGLKLVSIIAAVVSLSCQGLDELRALLQQFEVPYSELAELTKHHRSQEEGASMFAGPQEIGVASAVDLWDSGTT